MTMKKIHQAVLNLDREEVLKLTKSELDAGSEVAAILNEGLISALDEIGRRFSNGVLFVPEMILSAKIVGSALELLRPVIIGKHIKPKGTVVIGTVKGDLHDIGKNLVAMMLEGGGFEVIDLGIDVEPEVFIHAVKERKPHILAMSSLLTTTMPMMKQTIDAIAESGLRDDLKILVGGAPVTKKYADEINADSFAKDAPNAVVKARELINLNVLDQSYQSVGQI